MNRGEKEKEKRRKIYPILPKARVKPSNKHTCLFHFIPYSWQEASQEYGILIGFSQSRCVKFCVKLFSTRSWFNCRCDPWASPVRPHPETPECCSKTLQTCAMNNMLTAPAVPAARCAQTHSRRVRRQSSVWYAVFPRLPSNCSGSCKPQHGTDVSTGEMLTPVTS